MKVLHITDSINKEAGGVGSVVKTYHAGLLKANINSRVAAIDYAGDYSGEYFNSSKRLYENILKIQPDIIHIHGLWNRRFKECLKYSRNNDCKLVLSPYGMTHPWALNKSKFKKFFFKHTVINLNLDYISALISENDDESVHIAEFFNKPKKIFTINNPIETSGMPELKQILHEDYAYIGRISEQKGVNKLIDLWSDLRSKNLTNDSLLNIYGTGYGKYYNEFKRKVNRTAGVRFHGEVYGIAKSNVLLKAKALILNSEFEGQPVIAIEAMAHGLPVICNEKCGLNNEIKNKHCFLVKSTHNPIGEFSKAFEEIDRFEQRARVAMANYTRENYKSIKVISDIIKTYESICDKHF